MVNAASGALVETEVDVNKPFAVNFVVAAKRSRKIQRVFVSPEDRYYYLEADAFRKEFVDGVKVSAVVGGQEIEMDAKKTVTDAWKDVSKAVRASRTGDAGQASGAGAGAAGQAGAGARTRKGVRKLPLEDGQIFKVLVNGYSGNSADEMLVPVNEESKVVDQAMAERLIEVNKSLQEDKIALQEDKKLLLEEKRILTKERESLVEEKKDLLKERKSLIDEAESLKRKLDEIHTANTESKKRPAAGRSVLNILAGVIVGLVAGAVVSAAVLKPGPASAGRPGTEQSAVAATESGGTVAATESGGTADAAESDGAAKADLAEENAQLKAANEELEKSNEEMMTKLGEKQKEYDAMVEEKNAEIAKLQAYIDSNGEDGAADATGGAGAAEADGSSGAGGSGAAEADGSSGAGGSGSAEADGSSGTTGSGNERKVDSSLIMDADSWVEIVSAEDGSGKTVKYSPVSEYNDGVIVSFKQGSKSSFSAAVPEGYSTLSFDIGHIMDSGKFDLHFKVLVDGVAREDVGGTVKYTESPRHFDVTGLKADQVVTFEFDSDTYYVGEHVKYGMTNMVLR